MIEAQNGRFRFKLAYRTFSEDQGPAIHVFGPTPDAQEEEVLRFDCFDRNPHYHLAWSYRDEPYIPIEAEAPVSWSLETLRREMSALLEQAAALPMNEAELAALDSTLDMLERRAPEVRGS